MGSNPVGDLELLFSESYDLRALHLFQTISSTKPILPQFYLSLHCYNFVGYIKVSSSFVLSLVYVLDS